MKWQMKYLEEKKILYIKTEGEMSASSNMEMVKEAVALQSTYPFTSCLVDESEVIMPLTTMGVYAQAHVLSELEVPRNLRIAIIHPIGYEERYQFFETVSYNIGYIVKVFENMSKAMEWLES